MKNTIYTQEELNQGIKTAFNRVLSHTLLHMGVFTFITDDFDTVEFPNWQGRCTEDITLTAQIPDNPDALRSWIDTQVLRVVNSMLYSETHWRTHWFRIHTIVMKPDSYKINGNTFSFTFMLIGASIFYYYEPLLKWQFQRTIFDQHYSAMGVKNRIEMREKFGRCDQSLII